MSLAYGPSHNPTAYSASSCMTSIDEHRRVLQQGPEAQDVLLTSVIVTPVLAHGHDRQFEGEDGRTLPVNIHGILCDTRKEGPNHKLPNVVFKRETIVSSQAKPHVVLTSCNEVLSK